MVVAINKHNVKWLSPSPVWGTFSEFNNKDDREQFAQPNIMRFNNDMFMDELISVMTYYPDKLSEWKARQETWRQPMKTPETSSKLVLNEPLSALNKVQKREIEKRNQSPTATKDSSEISHQSQPLEGEPLKLYQPAQQRYYLVCASLVCQKRGLPDRIVDAARQEKVSFVLRRLAPDKDSKTSLFECLADENHVNTCDEYALVQTENGPQWKKFTDSEYSVKQAMPDEERLPMFTIGFSDLDNRRRRLLAGLIPVAKREAYINAPEYEEIKAKEGSDNNEAFEDRATLHKRDAIRSMFEMQVASPWKAIVEQAALTHKKIMEDVDINNPNYPQSIVEAVRLALEGNKIINTSREQIQTMSWYVLLDFANFIEIYLPDIWDALFDSSLIGTLSGNNKLLFEAMQGTTIVPATYTSGNFYFSYTENNSTQNYFIDGFLQGENNPYVQNDIKPSLVAALLAIKGGAPYSDEKAGALEDKLEKIEETYKRLDVNAKVDWPAFLFPLADPFKPDPVPSTQTNQANEEEILAYIDELTNLVASTVAITGDEAPEVISFKPPSENSSLGSREAVFVIRCIYEQPNCGPFNPAVLSTPTEPFQMASFFDPDAPGRPIRIPMPIDISPAGLRKFNKNTTFMISDMLCGKLNSIRELSFGDLVLSVLPWPFHKDLPEPTGPASCGGTSPFGMFCSLSIPIVTICAMVLLIIMVALFDLFFRWIPLLFVCLPIPGFKGKK